MDFTVMALYGALFSYLHSRVCIFALALFMSSYLNTIDSTWMFYAANCLFYLPGIFIKSIRVPAFCVMVHQYLMAWDGFLFPTTSTPLYLSYPYISFALELFIMYSIIKGARGDGVLTTNHRFDSHRLSRV